MSRNTPKLAICLGFAGLIACGESPTYEPGVTPSELKAAVDHTHFPLPIGARWVYRGTVPDGTERIEVEVLSAQKRVAWGAEATSVRDVAFLNDERVEETTDWYAEAPDGSVWYLGEDTTELENGQVKGHEGTWESGVDGALPGIAMPGAPTVGHKYRQEFYAGEAEDYGEVMAIDATVTTPAGSWTGCVRTHDTSAIDAALDELKYYCPGVGLALVEEGTVRIELIEVTGL